MYAKTILTIIAITGGVALYHASNWWERAYATYESSATSPDGCIRVDTFKPFWVLPSMFHRIPDPDLTARYGLGMRWDFPIFNRAYEVRTGELLGESIIFDPSTAVDGIDWGDVRTDGRRIVESGGFPLVDSYRCADDDTLANLDAYNKKGKWTIEPSNEHHERVDVPFDRSP